MADTKVVTGKVRFNFVQLFEPRVANDQDSPKFSMMILIPKTDTKTIEAIQAVQLQVLREKLGADKVKGKFPPGWTNTLRDGDEDRDADEYPEYRGHMFMNIKANVRRPPNIVDDQFRPILDATEVYSGCYGRVSMDAFTYEGKESKGVSFGIRNVQKLHDGEPLGGGGSKPEDDFGPLDGDGDDLI